MNQNTRLDLNDDIRSAMLKMVDGNPSAINALVCLVKNAETIDPDDFAGPFGPFFHLDSYGIYGSDIWILYKDICGMDVAKTLGVLRAVQLGLERETNLKHAIANSRTQTIIDPDKLLADVCKRLPNFNKNTVT